MSIRLKLQSGIAYLGLAVLSICGIRALVLSEQESAIVVAGSGALTPYYPNEPDTTGLWGLLWVEATLLVMAEPSGNLSMQSALHDVLNQENLRGTISNEDYKAIRDYLDQAFGSALEPVA